MFRAEPFQFAPLAVNKQSHCFLLASSQPADSVEQADGGS
jgi:hypothetical protein